MQLNCTSTHTHTCTIYLFTTTYYTPCCVLLLLLLLLLLELKNLENTYKKYKKIVSIVAMSLKNNIYVQFGLNTILILSTMNLPMNFNPCVSVRDIIVYFTYSHK